jgi:hypothetical protein
MQRTSPSSSRDISETIRAVVAGILFQVVEDYVLQGYSGEVLDQRVASKFDRRR